MTDKVNNSELTTEQLLAECEHRLSQAERNRSQKTEVKTVNDVASPQGKSKNRTANIAALQLLSEAYPNTFNRKNVRPLKIGIQDDLVADGKVAKNKIKRALASYVRSINYYRSLRVDAPRIDINGEESGTVTAEQAQHAKEKLKEINKDRREKQKVREQEERMSNKLEALLTLNQR